MDEKKSALLLEMIIIIKDIRNRITDRTDTAWTGNFTAKELQHEIDMDLAALQTGEIELLEKFKVEFLPTSTYQEIALTNGWSEDYLKLANRFDELYIAFSK